MKALFSACCGFVVLAAAASTAQAQIVWQVGMDDNAWPLNLDGGGANAEFVQETGGNSPLPGRPDNPAINQQADNDYYFEGIYTTAIQSVIDLYGPYDPVGVVAVNEDAAERAFAAGDTDLRYHFNLPDTITPNDFLSVTFDPLNLHTDGQSDPRYGVEVYVNGVLVLEQIIIRPPQLNRAYTTPQFTLADVNAEVGPGFDNIVTLKGINYNADGGGNWMGIDYIQLNRSTERIPNPTFPWAVGKDDNDWPVGDGGGANASFVQENGAINALPGSPTSTEVAMGADNDYYFAGLYSTVIAGNGAYVPVGLVPVNEEGAERAFAGGDLELRYHFNLPITLAPSDRVEVSFDALNLDDTAPAATRRFGVEVLFNGVVVQPQILITPTLLGKTFTTPSFTLGSVNAGSGSGSDNIVTLRGVSYNNDGGGNWMGIDYIQLNPATVIIPPPVLPWSVGLDDDGWPVGDGGGPNATFVQENGVVNALPGSATSPEVNLQADNDYYFAGSYTTTIAGNGAYVPVGAVPANEEAAERALTTGDTELRYHFNLPAALSLADELAVTFDALNLDTDNGGTPPLPRDPRMGVEVYVNGVLVQPQILIRPAQLGTDFTTPKFTLASVNAQVGPGFDNIVTLKGISYANDGGGNWMGIDYVTLNPSPRVSFPWSVGKEDNDWPAGNGGGPNTSFVQENGGINPLPGNPNNPEVAGQGDNDYYFAGIYNTAIDSVIALYGPYDPVGLVLVNEESAERAFAAADNDLRYHFNLPTTLGPDDLLSVTFDALNLDDPANAANTDLRYGVEVYFNGVLVQEQIVIRPAEIGKDFSTPPFTLASVGAQVGPGFDNIVSLKGINYNNDGGGNWMGIDYVQLNPVKPSPFPWSVGMDDDAWPLNLLGGGPNAAFVQEAGGTTPLPGSYVNPNVDGQGDNDYYFGGVYSTAIQSVLDLYGPYEPVGLVPNHEQAAERAFAGTDLDMRYHFNLPTTVKADDLLAVTFDALNLDDTAPEATRRFGVEVYFNGVLVMPQTVITPAQLGVDFTTPQFTPASVNAQVGSGFDNIVSLKGVSYNNDGGGNWMGIDYVQLGPVPLRFLPPTVSGGQITLRWTGIGQLERAPAVTGPWTPVTPAPASPYSEAVLPTGNTFFRLRK